MSEPLDLEPIVRRVQSATVGPWQHCLDEPYSWEIAETGIGEDNKRHLISSPRVATSDYGDSIADPSDDAEFMAHARQDIPALIAEVELLREKAKDALTFLEELEASDAIPGPGTLDGDTYLVVTAGLRIALTGRS